MDLCHLSTELLTEILSDSVQEWLQNWLSDGKRSGTAYQDLKRYQDVCGRCLTAFSIKVSRTDSSDNNSILAIDYPSSNPGRSQ